MATKILTRDTKLSLLRSSSSPTLSSPTITTRIKTSCSLTLDNVHDDDDDDSNKNNNNNNNDVNYLNNVSYDTMVYDGIMLIDNSTQTERELNEINDKELLFVSDIDIKENKPLNTIDEKQQFDKNKKFTSSEDLSIDNISDVSKCECVYEERVIDYDNFRIIEHVIDSHGSEESGICKRCMFKRNDYNYSDQSLDTSSYNIDENDEYIFDKKIDNHELCVETTNNYIETTVDANNNATTTTNTTTTTSPNVDDNICFLKSILAQNENKMEIDNEIEFENDNPKTNIQETQLQIHNQPPQQQHENDTFFIETKIDGAEEAAGITTTTATISNIKSKKSKNKRQQQMAKSLQFPTENFPFSPLIALKAFKSKLTPLAPPFHPAAKLTTVKNSNTSPTTADSLYSFEKTTYYYQQKQLQLQKQKQLQQNQQKHYTTKKTHEQNNMFNLFNLPSTSQQQQHLQQQHQYQNQHQPPYNQHHQSYKSQSKLHKQFLRQQQQLQRQQQLQQQQQQQQPPPPHISNSLMNMLRVATPLTQLYPLQVVSLVPHQQQHLQSSSPSSTSSSSNATINGLQTESITSISAAAESTITVTNSSPIASLEAGETTTAAEAAGMVTTVGAWPLVEAPLYIDANGEYRTYCPAHGLPLTAIPTTRQNLTFIGPPPTATLMTAVCNQQQQQQQHQHQQITTTTTTTSTATTTTATEIPSTSTDDTNATRMLLQMNAGKRTVYRGKCTLYDFSF